MPTCGKCQESVASSDITCPHCGALLAAYAPPPCVEIPVAYQVPDESTPYVVPEVEMEVKPPSEIPVVTDPNEVAEEPISTAPRPLFDTYLTVEEIARAAEGDHDEDVVTVSEGKIPTKKIEFDVPDYARPPSDAAPIPTIEEDDGSVPLVTRDTDTPEEPPSPPAESWLEASPGQEIPNPKGRPVAKPAAAPGPVSTTDTYVRNRNARPGHQSGPAHVSTPAVTTTSGRKRVLEAPAYFEAQPPEQAEEARSILLLVFLFVMLVLWTISLAVIIGGNPASPIVILTVGLTWQHKRVLKFMEDFVS